MVAKADGYLGVVRVGESEPFKGKENQVTIILIWDSITALE